MPIDTCFFFFIRFLRLSLRFRDIHLVMLFDLFSSLLKLFKSLLIAHPNFLRYLTSGRSWKRLLALLSFAKTSWLKTIIVKRLQRFPFLVCAIFRRNCLFAAISWRFPCWADSALILWCSFKRRFASFRLRLLLLNASLGRNSRYFGPCTLSIAYNVVCWRFGVTWMSLRQSTWNLALRTWSALSLVLARRRFWLLHGVGRESLFS